MNKEQKTTAEEIEASAAEADALKTLPLWDFQTICKRARSFLLRAEL